jgi:hypothetical protein
VQLATQSAASAAEIGGFLGSTAKVIADPANAIGGVINGTYDAAYAGPTAAQAQSVVLLDRAIVTGMKTSFFRRPMILTRDTLAAAPMTPTPNPTPGINGGGSSGSSSTNVDGYRAGIIVLALLTFFLVIALIAVAMRKPTSPRT